MGIRTTLATTIIATITCAATALGTGTATADTYYGYDISGRTTCGTYSADLSQLQKSAVDASREMTALAQIINGYHLPFSTITYDQAVQAQYAYQQEQAVYDQDKTNAQAINDQACRGAQSGGGNSHQLH